MAANDQHQYKDRYMLRLPDGLRERIKGEADRQGKSMNALIVRLLEDRFPLPVPNPLAELNSEISRVVNTLAFESGVSYPNEVEEVEMITRAIERWAESKQNGEPLPAIPNPPPVFRVSFGTSRDRYERADRRVLPGLKFAEMTHLILSLVEAEGLDGPARKQPFSISVALGLVERGIERSKRASNEHAPDAQIELLEKVREELSKRVARDPFGPAWATLDRLASRLAVEEREKEAKPLPKQPLR